MKQTAISSFLSKLCIHFVSYRVPRIPTFCQTRYHHAFVSKTSVIIEVAIHTHPGSNKGQDTLNLQYSCGLVGCHLRRKVVEFAVSHETHNPKVGGSNPPPATNLFRSNQETWVTECTGLLMFAQHNKIIIVQRNSIIIVLHNKIIKARQSHGQRRPHGCPA
jgi:hypothetical protein